MPKNRTFPEVCSNTNIAGVIGLTQDQIEKLLDLGAVSISDSDQWKRFKKNGFPHNNWHEFIGGKIIE